MNATARACINLALVKYWGKLPGPERLPAVGSLSLTVDSYYTETRVFFGAERDTLSIDGRATEGEALVRAKRVLDEVRRLSGRREGAQIESRNFVPAGEGLASSASAFAALAAAAARAAALSPTPEELAALARLGSGSAARSAFGGLCYIPGPGARAAQAVAAPADFVASLRMVIGRVGTGPKDVSSADGMTRTQATSPYFSAWVESHPADLAEAKAAAERGDFTTLGHATERSFWRMHASALAASPAVVYLRGPSLEAFYALRTLRSAGIEAYFTADAGAHPIAVCRAEEAPKVLARWSEIPGVEGLRVVAPGLAPQLLSD
jgi:diphosphomevalonate decarboxylase